MLLTCTHSKALASPDYHACEPTLKELRHFAAHFTLKFLDAFPESSLSHTPQHTHTALICTRLPSVQRLLQCTAFGLSYLPVTSSCILSFFIWHMTKL